MADFNLIEQAVKAISDNHCVDTQETRVESLIDLYVPDCVEVDAVKQHPEIQYLQAKEDAYDAGYDYTMGHMQDFQAYKDSDDFLYGFDPSTDEYDDVNGLYTDWLADCIDGCKEYSPWELIASEIDSFPDPNCVAYLWEAYYEGQALAIQEWVETHGLKNESDLLDILDDHEGNVYSFQRW